MDSTHTPSRDRAHQIGKSGLANLLIFNKMRPTNLSRRKKYNQGAKRTFRNISALSGIADAQRRVVRRQFWPHRSRPGNTGR